MDNKKFRFFSFLHSLGVVAYIGLVAFFMMNADNIFGQMDRSILGPIAFLLLFTLSAAIVGLLVLGRPAYMFLNGQKKEALTFLFYTLGWLVVKFIIIFIIILFVNQ